MPTVAFMQAQNELAARTLESSPIFPLPTHASHPRYVPSTPRTRQPSNEITGAIPTQLGLMIEMTSGFYLHKNSISSSIPTQLGGMSEMTSAFLLYSNSISSSIPTQLGQMSEMTTHLQLQTNSISSSIPTQLGQMVNMTSDFSLYSNKVHHPPRALQHLSL